MNDYEENREEALKFWRRFSNAEGRPKEARINPNLLAAYLDGTATREDVDAVERAMAADPELIDAVKELRSLSEEH